MSKGEFTVLGILVTVIMLSVGIFVLILLSEFNSTSANALPGVSQNVVKTNVRAKQY